MLERLRQVAFLVKDLEDAKALYRRYLGMETCHSEDLSRYGLRRMPSFRRATAPLSNYCNQPPATPPPPGTWNDAGKRPTC